MNRFWDKKGRVASTRGEINGNSKLMQDDVLQIRILCLKGFSAIQVAKMFGIDRSLVYLIMNRSVWSHV